jgi:O-antigen ligase
MRRFVWSLLLLFVFTIPWEYSLDLESPFGNIARITGLILLVIAVPAVLSSGRMRRPGFVQWLTLALYLWFCLTFLWTTVPEVTLMKLRGYLQEMMIVGLVWEFTDSPHDLRSLLRAWLAGSWVLALLTVANFAIIYPDSTEQFRFSAFGQDPNDVARFLDLGFPIAALLLDGKERWFGKMLAIGYLPLGFACVLLTASRGGFVAAVVALAGCGLLLLRQSPKGTLAGALGLSGVAVVTWLIAPPATFERIASIGEQLQTGDLNQRLNIWTAGWHAFLEAPLWGHGAGSFVFAARLSPIDTAHNTILSILVEGGLVSLALATAVVAASIRSVLATNGALQLALMTLMTVWFLSSLVGTVGESRTTWLLLGIIAVSHRLATEQPEHLERVFSTPDSTANLSLAERLS